MKAFKYICAALIFAIAAYNGYRCIGQISPMYFDFFVITLLCGVVVLLDGGRSNAKSRKKS